MHNVGKRPSDAQVSLVGTVSFLKSVKKSWNYRMLKLEELIFGN
jgi:hypothetical protein